MKIKLKYKKLTFFIGVFLFAPFLTIAGYNSQCIINARNGGVTVDVNAVLSCVEERYGYDSNTMRRSNRKTNAPTAEIYFDNTSPKEGEKVTATSVPEFFKNSNESLYYTWFILHDKNDDGKPDNTIEEGKKEAMGISARGNYDPVLFAADYSNGGDDPDADGFDAPTGGEDGYGAKDGNGIGSFESDIMTTKQTISSSAITRCYRRLFGLKFDASDDYNTGKDLIIECKHEFPQCGNYKLGDGKFTTGEEECWKLDPTNPDTDGDGVDDEADLVGLNQQQFAWNYKKGDRVGVIIEGTSMMPTNEDGNSGSDVYGPNALLTSYYKIMWGSLGICSADDIDFLKSDNCDQYDSGNENEITEDYDIGFNYWAAKTVEEEGSQNLDTDLKKTPDNPQVDMNDSDYTDTINVNAVFKNESANSNYAYFEWDIYRCDPDDLENCSSTGKHLTASCGEGDPLQSCAEEYIAESNSYSEGMSVNQISFKPKAELMIRDKEYLKVYLKTKRYKTDKKFSLSNVLIPIVKNDFKIKLYKVEAVSDPEGKFNLGDEICTEGVYRDVCPVFPFQVVAAKADYKGSSSFGSDVTFNWKVNGKIPGPLISCEMYEDSCELGPMIYFPVLGDSLFLGDLSLLVKRKDQDDLTAERIYSINDPLAVIKSDDLSSAWPLTRQDSSESFDVLQTYPGNLVALKADFVPDYLELDKDIYLTWYLDGNEVTEDFIAENPEFEITMTDNKLQYRVLGSTGGITTVTAKVEKMFSFDEKYALKQNWNILNTENLANENSISVKIIYPGDDAFDQTDELSSLGLFLASTAKNAPEYLITIVRLAVLLVIIWSILFGFSYLINPRRII